MVWRIDEAAKAEPGVGKVVARVPGGYPERRERGEVFPTPTLQECPNLAKLVLLRHILPLPADGKVKVCQKCRRAFAEESFPVHTKSHEGPPSPVQDAPTPPVPTPPSVH